MVFASVMTGFTALLGGWDTALEVFITMVVIDIVTGSLKGFFAEKKFSSKRMRKGFVTKLGYFIVIIVCQALDSLLPDGMPLLRTMAIYFYIAVETTSLLENLAQLGVPIPRAILDRLDVFTGKGGNKAKMGSNGKFESDDKKNG